MSKTRSSKLKRFSEELIKLMDSFDWWLEPNNGKPRSIRGVAKDISDLAKTLALGTVRRHLPNCSGCETSRNLRDKMADNNYVTAHQIDTKEHSPIVFDLEEIFGSEEGGK